MLSLSGALQLRTSEASTDRCGRNRFHNPRSRATSLLLDRLPADDRPFRSLDYGVVRVVRSHRRGIPATDGIHEAKAYVALVAAGGPLNGYEAAKRSGVPRSTVYETLAKLVARGAAFEVRTAEILSWSCRLHDWEEDKTVTGHNGSKLL